MPRSLTRGRLGASLNPAHEGAVVSERGRSQQVCHGQKIDYTSILRDGHSSINCHLDTHSPQPKVENHPFIVDLPSYQPPIYSGRQELLRAEIAAFWERWGPQAPLSLHLLEIIVDWISVALSFGNIRLGSISHLFPFRDHYFWRFIINFFDPDHLTSLRRGLHWLMKVRNLE